MKRTWWILILLVLALAGALAVGFRQIHSAVDAARRRDEQSVRARIEELGRLVTARYRYRDVVYFAEESRVLGLPAGHQEILFSVEMWVEAGIPMADGVETSTDPAQPGRLFVTLPAATITSVDADERSLRQYFVRERLGRLDWVDVSGEIERAKQRNRDDAIERGIVARAEEQARAIVTGLARSAGFTEVQVRFRPRERLRG